MTVCTIAYLAALLRLLSHSCLQLTFTALHLLGFDSPNEDPSLKDFLIKVRISYWACLLVTHMIGLVIFTVVTVL